MAAEMESLIADMLAKCYYHKQKRLQELSGQNVPADEFDEMI